MLPSSSVALPKRDRERAGRARSGREQGKRERGLEASGKREIGRAERPSQNNPSPGPGNQQSKRASPPIEAQNAHSSTSSSPPFVPSRIRSETASCVRAKLNFARRDQGRARVGIGGLFFRSLDGRFSGLDFFSPPAVTRQGKKLGPMPVPACLSSSRSSFSPQFSSTPLARAKPTVV